MTRPAPPGNAGTNITAALGGLLTGMFVSAISSTVVVTSLPVIVPALGGGQATYTWLATATLVAMTVSTPIWGKLADLFDRKRLFTYGIVLLIVASAVAGYAHDANVLIAMRVVQGVGAGGLAALSQIILADIVSPRERGRYAGMIGAVLTTANTGGPLIGGFITDMFGWRWNFFFVLPIAVLALLLVNSGLRLPQRPTRAAAIDYLGAALISAAVGLFLIWVTAGGTQFGRTSSLGWSILAGAGLSTVAAVRVELRAKEPLLPLSMFRNPTVTLSVIGSLATGAVMFSALVFLPQYFQFARGVSAVMSGLMTIPVMLGLMVSTTVVGRLITRFGHWKPYLIGGGTALVLGAVWLSKLDVATPYTSVAIGMLLLGTGVGALLQNLVVITQNAVDRANIGAATAAITFFRSLGGVVGIAALGAALQAGIATRVHESVAGLGPAQQSVAAAQVAGGGVVDPRHLPAPLNSIVAGAYGVGIGSLFQLLVVFALIALAAVIAVPPAPLGRTTAGGPAGGPPGADSPAGKGWSADLFRWPGDTIMLPTYTVDADGPPPAPAARSCADDTILIPAYPAAASTVIDGHPPAPAWADHPVLLPVYAAPGEGRVDRPPPAPVPLPTYTPGISRGRPSWAGDTIQMPIYAAGAEQHAAGHPPAREKPPWARDTAEWPIVRPRKRNS